MKVELLQTESHLTYQITEVQEQYRQGLLHAFYEEKDGVFSKAFAIADFMFTHDTRMLEANVTNYIEKMLNENTGVTPMDWSVTLKSVCEVMDQHQIRWWLAGSAACATRGIAIAPQDIDVMTFKSEIDKIEEAFRPYIVEPFHHVNDWVVKGFGVVYLNGRVDIAFEPESSVDNNGPVDFGPQAMSSLETVEWGGHSILVPPVELHLLPNIRRNRVDRVRLIEEYIGDRER